jgi:hypothetical protein
VIANLVKISFLACRAGKGLVSFVQSPWPNREGTHFCPTFDDAVTRHRMLKAIETAATTGQRQTLG